MGLPASLGPLESRDFRRYFAASVTNAIGGWASTVALSFGVLGRGSATDLGLVFLAREIPLVVFVLAGGVWADRWSRRSILVWTNALACGAQGVTAAALLAGWPLGVLAAAQVVAGGAQAFSRPAATGFIQELVPVEQLHQANGLNSLSWSSVSIIGAAVGAVLVEGVGAGWTPRRRCGNLRRGGAPHRDRPCRCPHPPDRRDDAARGPPRRLAGVSLVQLGRGDGGGLRHLPAHPVSGPRGPGAARGKDASRRSRRLGGDLWSPDRPGRSWAES